MLYVTPDTTPANRRKRKCRIEKEESGRRKSKRGRKKEEEEEKGPDIDTLFVSDDEDDVIDVTPVEPKDEEEQPKGKSMLYLDNNTKSSSSSIEFLTKFCSTCIA